MKICAVQSRFIKGDIEENIKRHISYIQAAAKQEAALVFFPELSITGYEPTLANRLAVRVTDERFNVFQELSEHYKIIICIGAPVCETEGILIGMLIFQPGCAREIYFKQQLHADEMPYFVSGNREVLLNAEGHRIAPAICYESLQIDHAAKASQNGADIYLASVAKSSNGINKGLQHYPAVARNLDMTVVMANSLGLCDDFESVGQSAVWDKTGETVAQLDDKTEGFLLYDTITKKCSAFCMS